MELSADLATSLEECLTIAVNAALDARCAQPLAFVALNLLRSSVEREGLALPADTMAELERSVWRDHGAVDPTVPDHQAQLGPTHNIWGSIVDQTAEFALAWQQRQGEMANSSRSLEPSEILVDKTGSRKATGWLVQRIVAMHTERGSQTRIEPHGRCRRPSHCARGVVHWQVGSSSHRRASIAASGASTLAASRSWTTRG